MIDRNSIVKDAKTFSQHNAKNCLNIPCRCQKILKTKTISFNYDVNDHVYFKLKSV